jgi:hypothetical protein
LLWGLNTGLEMKSRIFILLLVALFPGCIKVVDMDVGDIPDQLVVNCFFTEGEPFEVNVSRLAPYPDLEGRNIGNATVTILENNTLLGQLYHTGNGIYTNPSILPQPGFVYTIKAEAEGYPSVSASDSLPGKVIIDKSNYRQQAGKDEEGIDYNEFSVSFTDINEVYFYSIQVFDVGEEGVYNEKTNEWEKIPVWYPVVLFSQDPIIVAEGITNEDYSKYFVFNDALFKNNLCQLKLNTHYDLDTKFRVVLETGTENYYLYRKRLIKHESYSYQDPFKPYDPVPLYSNIENGLGIFAGYQRDIYELTIKED